MARDAIVIADAFKALGDPIRWDIVRQMVGGVEVAAAVLEDRLPVAKPTISYHLKILAQAGLIEVRKRGRHHSYALRPDTLADLLEDLAALLPGMRMVATDADPDGAEAADRAEIESVSRLLTW
ncbi:ArsR/SmtB family transcription factor [Nocardia bovistercoris]|uniref:Helix-turn-helix transcriptional regulator n=1 Tax=Nocardia bovistercoris TaxID=2785916 RepID=A0A931IFU0_9NOCA|nr:metalloregulator ArsR/SmtB family transcription factor [Nocardia bovistercoris]MBH0779773.1 helix-turn-helix transcriptional regulator [Nocardia bovistercoris]